jgi:uncharacterized protein YecE (DUF72 family)
MPQYFVGTSGWQYPHWRRRFYPKGLVQRRELEYLASQLSSVEVNGSFYSLQRPTSYQRWASQVPEAFVFALKGSRFITHLKQLTDVETPLANFFASGVLALGKKLGPIVWQLPPRMPFKPDLLARFFELLPRTHADAALLARKHDERLNDRACLEAEHRGPILHALEPRHESFNSDACFRLLRDHGIALAMSDGAGAWPLIEEITTDFVYVRLHGSTRLYKSDYSAAELDAWAERLARWGRDAYVYFDNDRAAYAAFNAVGLSQRLGIASPQTIRAA